MSFGFRFNFSCYFKQVTVMFKYRNNPLYIMDYFYIQGVPGGKDNILGGHSIGHSKQKTLYEHVSYSERFSR
jgi:hypothetical protein